MLGLHVTVPVACFRKGLAREFLETEQLPPPATCYGFLLSLVGEVDRNRHVGSRITAAIVGSPDISVVLRTVWRVKSKPLGSSGNTRPDFQQLLSGIELVIWLDSTDEPTSSEPTLENRVRSVVYDRQYANVTRFGGLSLGESTHLVDDVRPYSTTVPLAGRTFLLAEQGRMTLPVWVDHVGSAGTNYVTGDLKTGPVIEPDLQHLPRIESKRQVQ